MTFWFQTWAYLLTTAAIVASISHAPLLSNDKFIEFIKDQLREWNTPGGLGITLVRLKTGKKSPEWTLEAAGFGNATRFGETVSPHTQFCLGSNTKLVTVFMVGIALEESKVDYPDGWKTKICTLLPDWCLMHKRALYRMDVESSKDLKRVATEATIEDLMSHQTGWPRHGFSYSLDLLPTLLSSHLPNLKRSSRFRELYQYNDMMYMVLMQLPSIILKTEESFSDLVTRRIFRPLGMNHSTYQYTVSKEDGLADGFTREPGSLGDESEEERWRVLTKGRARRLQYWNSRDSPLFDGGDALMMSVHDATIWLQTLLLNGKNPTTGKEIIPASVIEKSATPLVDRPPDEDQELSRSKYGGAQIIQSYRGHPFLAHTGFSDGFAADIIRFPEHGFGLATFCNDHNVGGSIAQILRWTIVDRVLQIPEIDWSIREKDFTSRHNRHAIKSASSPIPRPPDSPISYPFTSLEGVYKSPSYGTVHLCLVSLSPSRSCEPLVSSLDIVLPGTFRLSPEIPTIVFAYNSPFISHVRLQHFAGPTWNVTFFQSTRDPDTGKLYPLLVPTRDMPQAEFSFWLGGFDSRDGGAGFGLSGIWGAVKGIGSPEGKTAMGRSEAWFSKILN